MKQYIVDAFTNEIFKGNPAAVCPLNKWIPDNIMQNIAKENNLSETAFLVKEKDYYHIRWFTPNGEIDFCGHATLAAAYIVKQYIETECKQIDFFSMSGYIYVNVKNDFFEMNFPSYQLHKTKITQQIEKAIGIRPIEAYIDRDLLLVLNSEESVIKLKPDYELMKKLDGLCIAVTARSKHFDCISRVFAPKLNIAEDPVTGSTHCMIIPYWASKLNKSTITAFQASERTGVLYAEIQNDRIKISGQAVLFSIADIAL